MDKNEDIKWAGIFLLLIVPVTVLRAFAMQRCWEWFISPTFNLRHLGMVETLGIALTCSAFIPSNRPNLDGPNFRKELIHIAVLPFVILIYGYIYKSLM